MEIYERQAAAAFPKGHYRVREGKLLSDDLVWDWVNKCWRRHDAEWDSRIENAEDAVFAVRKPKAPVGTTKYVIKREEPAILERAERNDTPAPAREQGSLF